MSRELYSALTGAMASWTRMEVVGNNLANVSTHGYKSGRVAFQVVGPSEEAGAEVYAQSSEVYNDLRDGSLDQTGNSLHIALQGPGYFSVSAGNEQLLTRNGRFSLDTEGTLVDINGYPVMTEGGTLQIQNETIRIDDTGRIFGSVSGEIDRLLLTDGPATPAGQGLWRADGAMGEATEVQVIQGALEESNVDPMGTMVELIDASRWFEAFQKTMQTSDQLDGHLLNLGR